MTEDTRSAEACPACGAHRLAVLDFPYIPTTGYQPFAEVVGMGEARQRSGPGIGCLACGSEWADLDAFRAARGRDRAARDRDRTARGRDRAARDGDRNAGPPA